MTGIYVYRPSRSGRTFSRNTPGRSEQGHAIYRAPGRYSSPFRGCLGTRDLIASNTNVLSQLKHPIRYLLGCTILIRWLIITQPISHTVSL